MSDRNRPLRLLALLLFALLAWFQYRLWFGEWGATATVALQDKANAQATENRGLAQRNAQLAAEVDDLKSGEAAVEERARSELGMIKPGETFHRVVETPTATPGSDEAQAEGQAQGDAP